MYAYPQRPGAAPPQSSQPHTSAFAQPAPQQQPYVPPPPPVVQQGNPSTTLYTCSSGSVTTLRLKAADEIRIQPPVLVPAELLAQADGAQSLPTLDLALERQLVEEGHAAAAAAAGAEAGSSGGGSGSGAGGAAAAAWGDATAFLAALKPGQLPRDPAVVLLAESGVTPQAAALGVAFGRAGRGGSEKAADFASKLEQLTGMGFSLAQAAGALAKHGGDVEAATESCLATAS